MRLKMLLTVYLLINGMWYRYIKENYLNECVASDTG